MIESMNSCSRGDYRIIRRNGAIVAFNPAKVARAVQNIYQAVSISPAINQVPCLSVSKDDASGSAGGASALGAGEGTGGESDSDGGDGDGDGPRRRSTKKSTSRQVSPLAQPTSPPHARSRLSRHCDKSDHEAPHRWSLITLTTLTLALLAAAVEFAHSGYPWLASEAMAMAGGLPLLARRLVKPR